LPADDDSLVIRRAERSDAAAIAGIYNDAILTTTATFDLEPKSVDEREQWLEAHSGRFPVLVGEVGDEIVGFASLSPWSDRAAYEGTAETALYVNSSHRGRGIGRRLKVELIDQAKRLGFHTLIARVTEDSAASIHLNLEAGFVIVGTMRQVGRKFGRLLDVHIMQKMLDEG
jgi:phosphinothricin acetyltransferase